MKALVLLREVLDAAFPVELAEGRVVGLKGSAAIRVLNPGDHAALEWGYRLAGGETTALTVGPPGADRILELALASGARRAIRWWAEGADGLDATALARLLALAVERLGPDLVLAGARSLEGGTGLVPGLLAARLGWPCLDRVVHLESQRAGLLIRRRLDRGWQEVVEVEPPVVAAVEAGSIEPRYVSVRARREAKRRSLEVWGPGDLGLDLAEVQGWVRSEVVALDWPRPRPERVTLPGAGTPGGERMRQLLVAATPKTATDGRLIEGNPRGNRRTAPPLPRGARPPLSRAPPGAHLARTPDLTDDGPFAPRK